MEMENQVWGDNIESDRQRWQNRFLEPVLRF